MKYLSFTFLSHSLLTGLSLSSFFSGSSALENEICSLLPKPLQSIQLSRQHDAFLHIPPLAYSQSGIAAFPNSYYTAKSGQNMQEHIAHYMNPLSNKGWENIEPEILDDHSVRFNTVQKNQQDCDKLAENFSSQAQFLEPTVRECLENPEHINTNLRCTTVEQMKKLQEQKRKEVTPLTYLYVKDYMSERIGSRYPCMKISKEDFVHHMTGLLLFPNANNCQTQCAEGNHNKECITKCNTDNVEQCEELNAEWQPLALDFFTGQDWENCDKNSYGINFHCFPKKGIEKYKQERMAREQLACKANPEL